jgi:sugar phosphate isomerase/epimerase
MPSAPRITLSAFADEAANHKTALEQLTALSAIGLKWYTPRFVDVEGDGKVQHVVELSDDQLKKLDALHKQYHMSVTSIGSRIGKVKLLNQEDGTKNPYVEPQAYIDGEVAHTIRAAKALGARLVRCFSFYHPRKETPDKFVQQAAERIGEIADVFAKEGLVYALEVEANLVGQNGETMAGLAKRVGRDNVVLIFDGGNLSSQGYSPVQCFQQYQLMRPYLGWCHIKDYTTGLEQREAGGHVNEDMLKNFVPANEGDSGHEYILRDLRAHLPALNKRMETLGLPGLFLELEPHVKGGGQFGGFSGPDGTGVAVRSLCRILDFVGIGYKLRDFEDIRAARGF